MQSKIIEVKVQNFKGRVRYIELFYLEVWVCRKETRLCIKEKKTNPTFNQFLIIHCSGKKNQ